MAAVPALPDLDLAFLEDLLGLHILQQGPVPLLMMLLNLRHHAEFGGQLQEALLLGGFGEAGVHVGPLEILAGGGGGKVLGGGADPLQLLEPHFRVLFLVVGGLEEQRGNLLKALLLGLGGEIGILVPGLGLSGKGGLQVFLCLRSGVFGHG